MHGAMLAASRGGDSDRPSDPLLCTPVNVGFLERWGSLAAGAALVVAGLLKRSPLGLLAAGGGGFLIYRGYTGHCPGYEAAGVSTAAEPALEVRQQCTVACGQEEAFRFWQDPANVPRFMTGAAHVSTAAPGHFHWTVELPAGRKLEWDTAVVESRPYELLGWESTPGGSVDVAGEVRFVPAPGDRGTEVHVRMQYRPPAGLLGETAAWLAGPFIEQMLKEDLRRFKRLLEAGEVPTTDGQPSGRQAPKAAEVLLYERPCPRLGAAASAAATAPIVAAAPARTSDETVLEASAQSFPASDAPGWTSTAAGTAKS